MDDEPGDPPADGGQDGQPDITCSGGITLPAPSAGVNTERAEPWL